MLTIVEWMFCHKCEREAEEVIEIFFRSWSLSKGGLVCGSFLHYFFCLCLFPWEEAEANMINLKRRSTIQENMPGNSLGKLGWLYLHFPKKEMLRQSQEWWEEIIMGGFEIYCRKWFMYINLDLIVSWDWNGGFCGMILWMTRFDLRPSQHIFLFVWLNCEKARWPEDHLLQVRFFWPWLAPLTPFWKSWSCQF